MSLDNVMEHYQSYESEPSACRIDPLDFDTEMSSTAEPTSAESFDTDIEMVFGVNNHSVEDVKDNDLEVPDAEPGLCTNGSNYLNESLAHTKANHNFNAPNKSHLNIEAVNLVESLRGLRLNDHSTTEELCLDDFAGLPSATFKTPNDRAPSTRGLDTSVVCGRGEARRIYLRTLRVYKEIRKFTKNPSMRTIQNDVGAEFLFNTVLKMSEKERWGLENGEAARLKREMSVQHANRRGMLKMLRGLSLS